MGSLYVMGYGLCVYNIWLVFTEEKMFIPSETNLFNYICLSLKIRHFDKYYFEKNLFSI